MLVTQISIDLAGLSRFEYVIAKQADANSRLIQVQLLNNGKIYVLDDQTKARVSITKPDKTEVLDDCKINNNMVEIVLDANMLAVAGTAAAEIILTGSDGTVTSASFDIKIIATVTGKNAASSSDYQSFKDALTALQNIDNRIAQKAEKAVVEKLTADMLELQETGATAEVIEAKVQSTINELIADGTMAALTVEDGTITVEKLSNDLKEEIEGVSEESVTAIIDDYMDGETVEEVHPLLITEWTEGYTLTTTGEVSANGSNKVTDYLPIDGTPAYIAYKSDGTIDLFYTNYSKRYICFYDENKTFISAWTQNQINFDKMLADGVSIGTDSPIPENAMYMRMVFPIAYTVYYGNVNDIRLFQLTESTVEYNNELLGNAIGVYAGKYLPEKCVGIKNFNFVQTKRLNLLTHIDEAMIINKSVALKFDCVGGSEYVCNSSIYPLANGNIYYDIVFYDAEGNEIDSFVKNATNIEYERYYYNYGYHYTRFIAPEGTVSAILIYYQNSAVQSDFTKNIGALYVFEGSVWFEHWSESLNETDLTPDSTVTEISSDFKNLINNSAEAAELQIGGVWIGLGDSYTVYADGYFRDMASKYGMIYDGQGKVSSTVCGDTGGNKGFSPFWSRMDGFISNYTGSGQTIDDATYTADDVRLITFMGGANDGFGKDTWLGSHTSMDTNYIYGACNYIFKRLRENFPNAEIICILQPANYSDVMNYTDDETAQTLGFANLAELQTWDVYSFGQYKMEVKERAVKECAERFGIPIVDCIFDWYSLVNPTQRSTYWNTDKIHLSAAGSQALAKKLEEKVIEIFS